MYEEALAILGQGSERDTTLKLETGTDKEWLSYVYLGTPTTSQC